eukprot:14803988-Alexandrium_andersonii.AAC.1
MSPTFGAPIRRLRCAPGRASPPTGTLVTGAGVAPGSRTIGRAPGMSTPPVGRVRVGVPAVTWGVVAARIRGVPS